MWQSLNSGTRKSRKQHVCFFCNEKILVGDKYDFRSGVTGDGWSTMEMHPECNEATRKWTPEDYECFSQGELKRGTSELR